MKASPFAVFYLTLGQLGASLAGNGIVDQLDLQFWKDRFGTHAGSSSDAAERIAVPEPRTRAIVLVGCLASVVFGGARRWRRAPSHAL